MATAGVTPVDSRSGTVRVGGQPAREVSVAPDGRTVYFAAPSGVFRGDTLVGPGVAAPNLLALSGDRLVSGSAPSCMRGDGEAPLRHSADGGKSWQDATGPVGRGYAATPRAARGDVVLALSCGGVIWSQDGGRTFTALPQLSNPNFEPRDAALSADGSTAYVAANSEGGSLIVLRATRTGATWGAATEIDKGWGLAALLAGAGDRIYLGTVRAVRLSTDRGATWTELNRGLGDELISGDPTGELGPADQAKIRAGVGVNDLALGEGTLLAATQHGVYGLRDGVWSRWPEPSGRVTRLAMAGSTAYLTTPNGVVRIA